MQRKQTFFLIALLLTFGLLLAACAPPAAAPSEASGDAAAAESPADDVIEIEYWQYNFEARITAMDELIEMFEAENPGIKVIHNSDIPYDDFRDKIAASVPAGVGPDVATLF
ncbi:MAG: hypothetical protein R3A44_14455 [Caldilineaceae bacterium]